MSNADEIVKVSYNSGDLIFLEGDMDYHFYIIESGLVEIFTKNEAGERVKLMDIEAGESFGEFALLDKGPRSASAKALTDVVLIRVSEQGYQHLLSELPRWASSMLKTFAIRIRRMNQRLKVAFPEQNYRTETEWELLIPEEDLQGHSAVLERVDPYAKNKK